MAKRGYSSIVATLITQNRADGVGLHGNLAEPLGIDLRRDATAAMLVLPAWQEVIFTASKNH